jgi:SAM-dependent methyltransferase
MVSNLDRKDAVEVSKHLDYLACPDCKLSLDRSLHCGSCDATFSVIRGIPRFVDSEHYVGNFGFQWNKHKTTQFDDDEHKPSETFLRMIGVTPEKVAGKRVLDAGCGAGRYSEVVNRWGADVTGLDLSSAVEASHENLASRGVKVLQGDILNPPLQKETFDLIFSVGVLHHTPDTKAAFQALVPLLKPGGEIVIWLYDAYNDQSVRMKLSMLYRKITWRMPTSVLYTISYLAVPYYYLNRIPLVGSVTGRLWHTAEHKDWRWRVLDTHDWYSPKYHWHHTYTEVWKWFEESGLVDLRISEPPVTVAGSKPK